jgi:putative hydrolase of the HAD superfamily
VRAVAFDLFHTLVDPEDFRPKEFRRPRAVAEALGLPVEEFERAWTAEHADRLVHVRPSIDERLRSYCARFGVPADAPKLAEAVERLERYQARALRSPRISIVEALRGLRSRRYVLGVVSNCDPSEVRYWSESPLAELFDAVVFSCEIGFAKPAPEAYLALVPRWGGVPLSEAAFVGDGSSNELVGARHAGFARVIFQGEFVLHNQLRPLEENVRIRADADTSIDSLGELEPLLTR